MARRSTKPAPVQRAKLAEVIPEGLWTRRPSGLLVQLAAGSYRAAENPRKRFRVVDGTGDFHLDDYTRQKLRAQSRDLERNNTFYDGALENFETWIVGSGPRPIFLSSSDEFNKAAQALWAEDAASNALDARGMFDWPTWNAMLTRGVVRDGDAPVLHSGTGPAMLLESERIDQVQLDTTGRMIGATLAATTPSGWSTPGSGTPIEIKNLSLPAWRTRPSQTRGHPACSAGLDEWERLDSLNEAEIISAETASLPWIVLSSSQAANGGATARPRNAGGLAGPGPETPDGWVRTDAGSMLGLPPGINGTPWTPNRPNLNVPEFVRMNLRSLSTPLLPYEILFVDIGALNYAAIRALGKLAKHKIRNFRTRIIQPTISRVVRDWARFQILKKRLPFVSDFAKHRWDWDELEIRDREKDATAVEREMANGTTTLQDELGPTWRDTVTQRAAEQQATADADVARVVSLHKAIAAANAANPGLNLHWSHIATLPGAKQAPGAYLDGAAPPPVATPQPSPQPDPAALTAREAPVQLAAPVALPPAPQPLTVHFSPTMNMPAQPMTLHAHLEAAAPAPIQITNQIDVAPTPVQVQVDVSPTPVQVTNQVDVAPTPVQINNQVDVTTPPQKPVIVEDLPDGRVLMTPQ
jgi:capsid protein